MKRFWAATWVLVAMLGLASAAAAQTITLLTHYYAAYPHGRALEEYIAEYEALNPGVNIELQFATNDVLLDRILLGAASGTMPDIVHIAGYMLGDLAEAGALAPLPDAVLERISDDYVPGALALTEYRGRHWGYPTEYMPRALVFNRRLFEAAGLPAEGPETWADLRDFSAKLTERNPDGSFKVAGFGVGLSSAGQMGFGMLFSLAYPGGARFLTEDGLRPAFNTPIVAEALGLLRELVSGGYAVAREWLVVDMRSGSVAMMVAPGPYWKTEFMNVGPEFYAGMATSPVPVPEPGQTPAAAAYGWLFAVTEKPNNRDAVYAFLDWLNTEAMPDGRTRMGNVLAHLGSIPVTYTDLRFQDTVADPFMDGFVQAVANGWTFADPVAPGALDMYRAIEGAIRTAVLGLDSELNALIEAERRVQALLDAAYR